MMLEGRVALITGGASGIGRATARRLADLGAHVVVADLNGDGAHDVATEICAVEGEGRAVSVGVDVTSEESVQEMVRRTVLAFGGLDILVCSAGIASSAPATAFETTPSPPTMTIRFGRSLSSSAATAGGTRSRVVSSRGPPAAAAAAAAESASG